MKYSIAYWVLCAILSVLSIILWPRPSPVGHFFRFWIWFAALRLVKYFLFRRVPIEHRFERKETVLVTGASCGIGAEVASSLAERGGKVIWTARDVNKAQQFLDDIQWTYHHGARGYVLYLDLASKRSIEKSVEVFRKREKTLQCVVLNAAYHGSRRDTKDGFEQSIGVNHLGHMYLLYLLMDMVVASAPSRIVVVTSDLHRLTKRIRFDDLMYERDEKDYTPFGAYNHSKLCNILFVRELARRLKGSEITTYAAHPGTPTKSEIMRESWLGCPLIDQLVLRPLYFYFCRSAYEGAQTPVYCAVAPQCANESGKYYENSWVDKPSQLAEDDQAAAKLWDMSCDLLGIPRDFVEQAVQQCEHASSR